MNELTETPLTETTYFILLSLSLEPKHGYAIMKEVKVLSESRVMLSTGTLYGALKRLLDLGWIVRLEKSPGGDTARDRKVYQLSQYGQGVLEEEITRLRKLLVAADLRTAEDPA